WFPHSLPTARAVLQYNLAVAFAIRGELEKAGDTLKQVWLSKNVSCDIPVHVIMLALYIELQLGHADTSRSIIKQHAPQYRCSAAFSIASLTALLRLPGTQAGEQHKNSLSWW
ncbi:unnamed protein product, partial [Timema podura]|nr:unnamed protein product [Timema podura]